MFGTLEYLQNDLPPSGVQRQSSASASRQTPGTLGCAVELRAATSRSIVSDAWNVRHSLTLFQTLGTLGCAVNYGTAAAQSNVAGRSILKVVPECQVDFVVDS